MGGGVRHCFCYAGIGVPYKAVTKHTIAISMDKNFLQAMEHRRTIYNIGDECGIEESQIVDTLQRVLLSVPSAFNGQTTRLVLLMGAHHYALWEIVKHTLAELIPPEAMVKTRAKIDGSFQSGCGTVLFFEDTSIVEEQKRAQPTYAAQAAAYSEQTSAMHQFAIWTLLEDMGFGASLQHYNPLIDSRVAERWGLPTSWRLMAQMPFGRPLSSPPPREQHLPITERLLLFTK